MATTAPEDVCLATNLDAFVLNEAVCESGLSRIAPITQPNYVSLRLNNSVIQHDLLPTVDLHNSQPALVNPRISKALTGDFQNLDLAHPSPALSSLSTIDRTRLGVYLHWTVPRAYRSGASQAPSADPSSAATANPNPKFRLVPNRWLLVRILREWAPQTAQPDQATAWIIESDKLRKIEELGDSVDLETDVTPFVAYAQDADSNSDILNNQAENYIGLKTPLAEWQGEHARRGDADRVPLTVMNSSNPLFADYAIHNPNVFSTKDNFAWGKDASGGPLGYLDMALCDYFVVGWHADTAEDPLGAVDANMPSPLRTRLSNLFCAAPANSDGKDDAHTSDTTTVQDNGSVDSTRIFCHAARYGVKFDKDDKTKPKTPADDYAAKFIPTYSSSSSPSSPGSSQSYDMEPVAVGTTPLDAVLAFFQAHEHDPDFEPGLFHDGNAAKTAQTLMELQELLYATEDDYDSRAKAADLIFQHNFTRNLGGSLWHYNKRKAADGPPATPSETKDPVSHMSELDYLNQLNECQQTWDAADRKLDQLRWALFAEFFKYVSDGQLDPTNTQDPRLPIYTSRIPLLRSEAVALQAQQAALQKAIDGITGGSDPSKALLPVKKIAGGSFFRRADPSLCLVGVDGGWDPQFVSGNTSTRYAHQLAAAGTGEDASPVKGTLDAIRAKLGPDLAPTVSKLLTESAGGYQPSLAAFGHKPWTEQPFCPQFVEWEGIYYHIDDSQWAVALANSALCDSNHKHVTYTNPNRLSDTPQIDQLHISGRMLVLPQPAFALDAVVAQVLGAALPQDLPPDLQTADQQAAFRQNLQSLKFISGQLTGLSDALLTMAVGQHVKPNVRQQGGTPQPIHAAVDVGSKYLHMTKDDFTLMAAETSKTPYGTLVDFTASNPHPFKAVQHGQFGMRSSCKT
ncbi:hypothetical protein GQ53DRAFT_753584 [Thozetella sp. PMI_491]|nr:hypothetical protein GQ53DRAFT_753584 [Thozetella sp. PMI_491]